MTANSILATSPSKRVPIWGWVCRLGLFSLALTSLEAATLVTDISEDTSNGDGVTDTLDRRRRLQGMSSDREEPEWLQSYRKTRDGYLDRIGLDIGANYDVAGLVAFGGQDTAKGFSGDFTVSGLWLLTGDKWRWPLDLQFRVRDRHAIGGRSASEVAAASGDVSWNMIDGFSDAGLEVPDFQLVQHLPKRDLEIHYGQMTIDSYFDRHALRSSKQAFFNRAFSSNPAVAFPRFGAGVTAIWKPKDIGFDFTLGASSVQGTQNGQQVDLSFGSSDFFSALQVGRDYELWGNKARGQLMIWHSDAVQDAQTPSGHGASLTFEHWIASSNNRLFARAAWSEGGASDTDRMLSTGIALERPDNDLVGFAVGMGRDSSGSNDWQAVFETFYRWQIGPSIQITPEAQFLFGSGLKPDKSFRLVAGLRAEISF